MGSKVGLRFRVKGLGFSLRARSTHACKYGAVRAPGKVRNKL